MEVAEFVAVHFAGLLRTAFLLTGDRHAAEGLIRSWAQSQRTTLEQPGAFVRRCMVNVFLTQRRRRLLVREEPADLVTLAQPLRQEEPDRAGEVVDRVTLCAVMQQLPAARRAGDAHKTFSASGCLHAEGLARSGGWRLVEGGPQSSATIDVVDDLLRPGR